MEILYVIGMIAVFVLCLALFSTARRILRSSSLSSGQFGASRMYDVESSEDEASTETDTARRILSRIEGRGSEANADPVWPEKAPDSWYERSTAAAEASALFTETKPEMTSAPWHETALAAAETPAPAAEAKFETTLTSWYEKMAAAEEPAASTRTKIDDYKVIDEPAVDVSLPSMASEMASAFTENPPDSNPYSNPDLNPYMDDFEPPQEHRWARLHKPSRQKYNYALECLLLGVSAWVLIRTQRSALRLRAPQSSDRVA